MKTFLAAVLIQYVPSCWHLIVPVTVAQLLKQIRRQTGRCCNIAALESKAGADGYLGDDGDVELNVLECRVALLGTN